MPRISGFFQRITVWRPQTVEKKIKENDGDSLKGGTVEITKVKVEGEVVAILIIEGGSKSNKRGLGVDYFF